MHWLIVIPYYFLGALVLAGLLAVTSRLFRIAVPMERLGALSALGSMGVLAVLLVSGAVRIEDLTTLPVIALGLASFVLAGLDAMLAPRRHLESARHRASAPQVL